MSRGEVGRDLKRHLDFPLPALFTCPLGIPSKISSNPPKKGHPEGSLNLTSISNPGPRRRMGEDATGAAPPKSPGMLPHS